jgi:hypothetical protein
MNAGAFGGILVRSELAGGGGGYHLHQSAYPASQLAVSDTSLGLCVVLLLIALVAIEGLRLYFETRPIAVESTPVPPKVEHVEHRAVFHPQHRKCNECGLVVARYDERGVCANCVSEGK